MEKYLSAEALSSGVLSDASKSPLHFKYAYEGAKQMIDAFKDKSHFDFGTWVHGAILEPTAFSRIVKAPNFSRASIAGIADGIDFYENFIRKHHGIDVDSDPGEFDESKVETMLMDMKIKSEYEVNKLKPMKAYLSSLVLYITGKISFGGLGYTFIDEENYLKVQEVKKNYFGYAGGIIPRLMTHSKREISVYATDPETGLRVKIRPDALQFKENIGLDAVISVKTTRRDNLKQFAYDVATLNYPMKEAMYQDVASYATGRDFSTTILVMAQTSAPFGVALYIYDKPGIDAGRYRYNQAKYVAKKCISEKWYPGFETFAQEGDMGMLSLEVPNFYLLEQPEQNV
jgi:hypothetical protein